MCCLSLPSPSVKNVYEIDKHIARKPNQSLFIIEIKINDSFNYAIKQMFALVLFKYVNKIHYGLAY